MQQRRPRLGDILDDYCPRERRVTNHAVVAIVDDDVRQTRCTTCEAEHEYRQARVPTPRRPKSHAALTQDGADGARPVLAVARPPAEPAGPAEEPPDTDIEPMPVAEAEAVSTSTAAEVPGAPQALAAAAPSEDSQAGPETAPSDDDGPVHRRLIRATFPRPEGQVPERREPEFTIRQPGGRGRDVDGNRGGFRGRNQRGQQGGGGSWGFGARQGGGFGSDSRGGRGGGWRGDNRSGSGGGQHRGQRPGGRKGGR